MEILPATLGLLNSSTLIPLLITVISIATILHFFFPYIYNANTSVPSPLALPIIGHLHLLGPLPHQSFHRLSLRFGPLFRVRLGCISCLVASSPRVAQLFLKTHEASFPEHPISPAAQTLVYDGSNFSFAPYGPYWLFIKKLCTSQLFGSPTLDLLYHIRRDEIQRLVTTLFDKSKRVEEVDLETQLVRLASNIVSRMSIGRQWAGRDEELAELKTVVSEIEEILGLFDIKDYIWLLQKLGYDLQGIGRRVKDVRGRFDRMVEGVLEEKEAARQRKLRKEDGTEGMMEENRDILDMLMDVYDDDGAEIRLTRDNIKAFILDVLAAGTSTTALTIEWALAELINHPNILTKLAAEIETVVGKDRLVDEADIPRLPYLQAVIKETLRLHPTGPLIARRCTEACTVDGYNVPAGMTVFVNVWALGRDPESWTNPLDFYPERFLDEERAHGMDVKGQHYQFLPFGTGRRMCPGAALAMLVVHSTIAAMVQCFEWKLSGGGLVDMEEGPGMTLTRAKPLLCLPVPPLHQLISSL